MHSQQTVTACERKLNIYVQQLIRCHKYVGHVKGSSQSGTDKLQTFVPVHHCLMCAEQDVGMSSGCRRKGSSCVTVQHCANLWCRMLQNINLFSLQVGLMQAAGLHLLLRCDTTARLVPEQWLIAIRRRTGCASTDATPTLLLTRNTDTSALLVWLQHMQQVIDRHAWRCL